jgi:hypothetical protein
VEKWRSGEVETWRRGDVETWRRGDVETWRRGEVEKSSILSRLPIPLRFSWAIDSWELRARAEWTDGGGIA